MFDLQSWEIGTAVLIYLVERFEKGNKMKVAFGLILIFISIWGGFFTSHITAGTWMKTPTILTAVIVAFIGIGFLISAADESGEEGDE